MNKYFGSVILLLVTSSLFAGQFSKRILGVKGTLKSSLNESMTSAGLKPELIMQFTDIFSWNIDFYDGPREGDTYNLIWEGYFDDNKLVSTGKILVAQYQGKEIPPQTAVYFKDSYYSPDEKSLRKYFLRAPLNYRSISSYFSIQHESIDYDAPAGTPVSTVGDGTVIFVGNSKEYGNFVEIRHDKEYTTGYGHLSRFARRLKKGKIVNQGQIIGFVGSTGIASVPKLNFSIKQNGHYVNFLMLNFPPAGKIKIKDLPEFNQLKNKRISQLNVIVSTSTQELNIK